MRTWDCSDVQWRKSSYSSGDGANGNCVEAAVTSHRTGIRDTKAPEGGTIVLPAPAWADFLRGISR